MSRVDDWLNHLQEHGYRLTTPRKVVVETVAESQHVLSPLEIYEQARERYSRLGLVSPGLKCCDNSIGPILQGNITGI